jgi:hypothetical protein
MAQKAMPMQMPTAPGLLQAQVNAQVQQNAAARQQANLAQQTAAHGNQMADIQKALEAHRITHSDAMGAYNTALENAQKLGVGPEPTVTPEEALAGDKWNKKVVGDMGPGGKSVTESARNYRIQQGLSESEAAKFKANRAGLIVPNELPTETPLTAQQQKAKKALEQAEKKMKDAAAKVAEHEGKLESLNKKGPFSRQTAEKVASKAEKAKEAADKLAELEKFKPGALSSVGKYLGKLPGFLGGAGAGYEASLAANEFNKGNMGPALLHGASAIGGGLTMLPHPAAKAVGALMMAPQLGYDIYQELK